ncbi:hypothetical protein DQ384_39235 [Sphaerisporangium album]|uniref:Uncharacterized protein n=2 Tax=Sphaerisporangium album TaxID=509200 RepID=A0A367EJD5_9ACTN|nr:hypothetical protein DQ384_39235 [Sphaerisporangium album]
MRLSPDGGRTFPRYRGGRLFERQLQDRLPSQPATIPTCDPETGMSRLLAADFDVHKAQALHAPDPHSLVAAQAADFAALIARCGGRAILDGSPSGGRHVYVLWQRPLPHAELNHLALALARRYSTCDPGPMSSPFGQIRPPGAPHKTHRGRLTGWMHLLIPLDQALQAVNHPCGAQTWNRLMQELEAELAATAPIIRTGPGLPEDLLDCSLDDSGVPWLPQSGGRRPIRRHLEQIAVHGTWRRHSYPSASHARQAIVNSAAAAGWRLEDLVEAMATRRWPWLARAYAKYSPTQQHLRLHTEWQKALAGIAEYRSERNGHTREKPSTRGGAPPSAPSMLITRWPRPLQSKAFSQQPDSYEAYQRIRIWLNAVIIAENDPQRRKRWGRRLLSVRKVLRALGAAAQMGGGLEPHFGVRSLSLMTGLGWSCVARVLQLLREEPAADRLIDLTREHHGTQADHYTLTIPAPYRHEALWRRWRAGNIEIIHPGLWDLAAGAAFVYQALLPSVETTTREVIRLAGIGSTAGHRALQELAAHGLADKGAHGWRRGTVTLDDVAERTGTTARRQQWMELYREQRRQWHEVLTSRQAAAQAHRNEPCGQRPIELLLQDGPPGHHGDPASLAGQPPAPPAEFTSALQLLRRELGAVILRTVQQWTPTRATAAQTDGHQPILGSDEKGPAP